MAMNYASRSNSQDALGLNWKMEVPCVLEDTLHCGKRNCLWSPSSICSGRRDLAPGGPEPQGNGVTIPGFQISIIHSYYDDEVIGKVP
ncbi:hypothetical protein AVEN_209458-1 [Araneus ventricosus]|uniref:Uncharacterized protein n=1 Tax=Araneus ventricosus TaxID=182803 RepID=A0A4Y2VYU8_ARAVE|nr:hypothetical protein AVEN_209458-1 [Araneus ventricosus]